MPLKSFKMITQPQLNAAAGWIKENEEQTRLANEMVQRQDAELNALLEKHRTEAEGLMTMCQSKIMCAFRGMADGLLTEDEIVSSLEGHYYVDPTHWYTHGDIYIREAAAPVFGKREQPGSLTVIDRNGSREITPLKPVNANAVDRGDGGTVLKPPIKSSSSAMQTPASAMTTRKVDVKYEAALAQQRDRKQAAESQASRPRPNLTVHRGGGGGGTGC